MITLVINGVDADVLQTETIIGEYAIAPIGDISKRVGARSISFKLPKTANNRAIFESCEVPTSVSNIPYEKINCRLYVDGVDMNMRFCTLEKVDQYYNIRTYGTNSNLFIDLKNKKLSDLDLSAYNHHWGVEYLPTTYPQNFPIKYPAIDFNTDSPNAAIPNGQNYIWMGTLLPCVYESFIIQKILSEAGYTLNNETKSLSFFNNIETIIPLGSKEMKRDTLTNRYLASFQMNDGTISVSQQGNSYPSNWLMKNIISQNERYYNTTNSGLGTTYERPFLLPDALILRVNFQFEIRAATTYNDLVGIEDTNFQFANNSYYTPVRVTTNWQTVTINKYINCYSQNINGDYFFKVVIRPSTQGIPTHNVEVRNARLDITESANFNTERTKIEYATNRQVKTYITIANNLPELTQADFLKDYLVRFSSTITLNEFTNNATISPYKNILDNINNAIDWSGKLDYTNKPQVEFELDYAQNNSFLYSDDEAITKPLGTDFSFTIPNENLESQKNIFTSKFTASPLVIRQTNKQMAQIPIFTAQLINEQSKPKILIMAIESGTFTYRKDIATNTGSVSILPHWVGYFIKPNVSSLGFGNNIFVNFFNYILGIVTSAKKYEVNLKLTLNDISTFDFLKPVYIRELDTYFYVNKIKFDYTSKNSSVVELIKLL